MQNASASWWTQHEVKNCYGYTVNEFIYTIRRSRRAKHILLHVNADGSVELVIPQRASIKQAEVFLEEKRQWIIKMREKQREKRAAAPLFRVEDGAALPWFGTEFHLKLLIDLSAKKTSVREDGGVLNVRAGSQDDARVGIKKWYRKSAKDFFVGRVIEAARQAGVRADSVRVTNPKTQWGSCNKQKRALTFSWRLALAPRNIADYVVAHEVAHLEHANHSRSFWQLVEQLMPDYKQAQQWLRKHGIGLDLE